MDITVLNRRKGSLKAQITKLTNSCDKDAASLSIVELSNKLEIAQKIELKLDELKNEYYAILKDDELPSYEEECDNTDEMLQKLKVSLKKFLYLKNNNVEINNENVNDKQKHSLNVRLPEIPLPKFSGLYSEWLSFKSQFSMLIDNNIELNSQQKLFYLQSALIGQAKQLQSTEDSYESLFTALKNRFENMRLIANSHVLELLNVGKLKSESSKELQQLLDTLLKNLRALKQLNIESNTLSDLMLINSILPKLDFETRKMWELSLTTSDIPKWDNFIDLLQKRVQMLENAQTVFLKEKHQFKSKCFLTKTNNNVDFCKLCKSKAKHPLYKCPAYQTMKVKQRFDYVKSNNFCVNCLSPFHSKSECNSKVKCITCNLGHHSSLHFESRRKNDPSVLEQQNERSRTGNSCNQSQNIQMLEMEAGESKHANCLLNHSNKKVENVLLATATIYVRNYCGVFIPLRCIFDCGSQACLLTTNAINLLGLKTHPIKSSLCGLSDNLISVKAKAYVTVSNKEKTFEKILEMLVVPKISDVVPTNYLNVSEIQWPKNIAFSDLADESFYIPSKVDMLLGSEIVWDLLESEKINLDCGLVLRKTKLGYIVTGSLKNNTNMGSVFCGLIRERENLNEAMEKFWELENYECNNPIKGNEEEVCENNFLKTHYRNDDGTYVVQMPLKENFSSFLGESKQVALRRLDSLWKRLIKQPHMLKLYIDFMKEYEELNHMEEVEESQEPDTVYYVPHHGVYRPLASSTQLRVVFNASTPTTSGYSLNSLMLNGGTIQDELFAIILRFRKHKYAFTADIEKMFRKILIDPQQRDLQRIVWKENINAEPKVYKLCTVTYGMVSAPFLATRCLKQLVVDEGDKFPLAATVVREDMYVDDVLSGTQDIDSAMQLQQQLIELLKCAGMKLHKWSSNAKELLLNVPNEDRNYNFDHESDVVKTLGLIWNPRDDCFKFTVSHSFDESDVTTKRSVLSDISKLFDPMGLLGPVIVRAKIFIQKLWVLKLDWDQTLPEEELKFWNNFRSTLHILKDVNVNRYILCDNVVQIEVHGFADACNDAYGAVLYLRCISSSGDVTVNLLCSKSRVTPLKTVTIPRLELCAAVLLAKLTKRVTNSLKIDINNIFFYSDSKIVLSWIKIEPRNLKTFVGNRVSVIQQLTDVRQWHHVSSQNNAADLVSRGMEARALSHSDLWWEGPKFLHEELPIAMPRFDEIGEISRQNVNQEEYFKELTNETTQCFNLCITNNNEIIEKLINSCSTFLKTVRVLSFVLRFLNNCRKFKERKCGVLTAQDVKKSKQLLISRIQNEVFKEDILHLKKFNSVDKKSKLRLLNPFIDNNGLLRVGGRLTHANISFDAKYPIILPNNHRLTELIFIHFHLINLHVGPQSLLHLVRQEYWPLKGRNLARKTVHNCYTCFRYKPVTANQLMGDLPPERVNPSSPFNICGVDYCGPFYIKFKGQRKGIFHKIYVAIFVCFTTKAIHLEPVTDLTTDAFIASLKRFFARRGKSSVIFSDNATNFVGAQAELKRLHNMLNDPGDNLASYLSSENITWKFSPPRAPNFGGLYESGVKSFKYHLKRSIGNSKFTLEEFLTVITQIEGILNSRPLTPLSTDVQDPECLTPGHFLIGRALNALPEQELIHLSDNRLSRWQLVAKVTQTIWKRWKRDYLNHLQQRSKWYFETNNIVPGTIVLLREDNLPPGLWCLGKIETVFPGPDNKVRVVLVKTKSGTFKRPITKICILPQN